MTLPATFWSKIQKTDAALLRIAAALEQIAKTLEAIRSQVEPITVHLDSDPNDITDAGAQRSVRIGGAW